MRDSDHGFTLLEVLIAFVIAALAIGAMLRAGMAGVTTTTTAAHYQQAISRARSHLDAAAHGGGLRPHDNQGDDGSGFHWRERVVAAQQTALPGFGTRQGTRDRLVLYVVDVWITWRDAGAPRSVHLSTQQLGVSRS